MICRSSSPRFIKKFTRLPSQIGWSIFKVKKISPLREDDCLLYFQCIKGNFVILDLRDPMFEFHQSFGEILVVSN